VALLEVSGVDAFYGRIQALHRLSINVEEGEVVTLIGSNGAGKSTTCKVISGLVRAAAGAVRLLGREITNLAADRIVTLGISHSPEGRRIFSRMTVVDNLELGAYTQANKAQIAPDMDRVFQLFPRLAERRNQLGGTLSGGEQQMLAIGRALMSRPRVLLLDEPSMGLAPVLVQQVFATISDINKQGTTVLLIEQNANLALRVANRGYVLETGHIVLEDRADKLLASEVVRKSYLGED
jgi:branched-chain amino acid transport system ATP-binding protein